MSSWSSSSTFRRFFCADAWLVRTSSLVTPWRRLNALAGDVALRGASLLAELLLVDAGPALELGRAAVRALDLLDERAQLDDDAVDRLLVEAHLLERLDHLRAVGAISASMPFFGSTAARRERLGEILPHLVEVLHLVDEAQDAAVRLLLVELAVLLVGVADDLLDADLVLPELVAEVDDLADGDRAVQDGAEDGVLALLDALGDLDLALAGEERDAPHLPEVHPDRVVALRVVRAVGLLLLLLAVGARDVLLLGVLLLDDAASGAIFTWVAASTISMSSSPRAPMTSSIWSATTSAGRASLTSS
jgi:hypothetical protein